VRFSEPQKVQNEPFSVQGIRFWFKKSDFDVIESILVEIIGLEYT